MCASRRVVDWLQLVLGAAILWAPGLAWTWALAPGLDWAKFLAASVVVAASVQPAITYLLNVFFGMPVSPTNVVLICLALTAVAMAWAIGPRLERVWE